MRDYIGDKSPSLRASSKQEITTMKPTTARHPHHTRHHRLETMVTVLFLAWALAQHIWIHTFK